MIKWIKRTFLVISKKEAIELDLSFHHNIHGENINRLGCRSIWIDKEDRQYRVKEYIKRKEHKLIKRQKTIKKY